MIDYVCWRHVQETAPDRLILLLSDSVCHNSCIIQPHGFVVIILINLESDNHKVVLKFFHPWTTTDGRNFWGVRLLYNTNRKISFSYFCPLGDCTLSDIKVIKNCPKFWHKSKIKTQGLKTETKTSKLSWCWQTRATRLEVSQGYRK